MAAPGSRHLAAWRSTAGAGDCGARCTGRAPRVCRSPGRGRSSRATSSAWSRGWRRGPTSRRSSGCCGSTGTRSGGSSRACAPMSSIPAGWTISTRSASTRSAGSASTSTSRSWSTISAARWCGDAKGPAKPPRTRSSTSSTRRRPTRPSAKQPHAASEPAIMVPFGPCPTVPVGHGIPGAWLERPASSSSPRSSRAPGCCTRSRWTWAPATPSRSAQHAPQAVVCIDPYHVVQLANQALDEVRRAYWNELRSLGDQQAAKRFKDSRWCAAQETREAHRRAGHHTRPDQGRRRRGLARLHAQRGRPRHLRARPHRSTTSMC